MPIGCGGCEAHGYGQKTDSGHAAKWLESKHVESLQKTAAPASLVCWWVAGATPMTLDALVSNWTILVIPKLQSRIAIVAQLTVNGCALHRYLLSLLEKAGSVFSQRQGPLPFAVLNVSAKR